MEDIIGQLPPDVQQQFMSLPPEQQEAVIQRLLGGGPVAP